MLIISELQEAAWKNFKWNGENQGGPERRKYRFKEVALAVKFTSNLFGKALQRRIKAQILYATETGRSERFARRLAELFNHAFNAQVNTCSRPLLIFLKSQQSSYPKEIRFFFVFDVFVRQNLHLYCVVLRCHSIGDVHGGLRRKKNRARSACHDRHFNFRQRRFTRERRGSHVLDKQ